MVHALEEIHRTLVPSGLLIDLRPVADRWPVEVVEGQIYHSIGRLTDLPAGLADDEAANNAILEAARRGWFRRESKQNFPFFFYWDTPEEMKGYILDKWSEFILLEDSLYTRTQDTWKVFGPNAPIRVKRKMLLAHWRKH